MFKIICNISTVKLEDLATEIIENSNPIAKKYGVALYYQNCRICYVFSPKLSRISVWVPLEQASIIQELWSNNILDPTNHNYNYIYNYALANQTNLTLQNIRYVGIYEQNTDIVNKHFDGQDYSFLNYNSDVPSSFAIQYLLEAIIDIESLQNPYFSQNYNADIYRKHYKHYSNVAVGSISNYILEYQAYRVQNYSLFLPKESIYKLQQAGILKVNNQVVGGVYLGLKDALFAYLLRGQNTLQCFSNLEHWHGKSFYREYIRFLYRDAVLQIKTRLTKDRVCQDLNSDEILLDVIVNYDDVKGRECRAHNRSVVSVKEALTGLCNYYGSDHRLSDSDVFAITCGNHKTYLNFDETENISFSSNIFARLMRYLELQLSLWKICRICKKCDFPEICTPKEGCKYGTSPRFILTDQLNPKETYESLQLDCLLKGGSMLSKKDIMKYICVKQGADYKFVNEDDISLSCSNYKDYISFDKTGNILTLHNTETIGNTLYADHSEL